MAPLYWCPKSGLNLRRGSDNRLLVSLPNRSWAMGYAADSASLGCATVQAQAPVAAAPALAWIYLCPPRGVGEKEQLLRRQMCRLRSWVVNGSLQRWDAESPALSRVYGRPLHGLHFKKGGTEGW